MQYDANVHTWLGHNISCSGSVLCRVCAFYLWPWLYWKFSTSNNVTLFYGFRVKYQVTSGSGGDVIKDTHIPQISWQAFHEQPKREILRFFACWWWKIIHISNCRDMILLRYVLIFNTVTVGIICFSNTPSTPRINFINDVLLLVLHEKCKN